MSKQIIVSGGRLLVPDGDPFLLAEYVLKASNSGDNAQSINNLYKSYEGLTSARTHLPLFSGVPPIASEAPEVREIILNSDIVYVGGGRPDSMLAVWKVHGVDKALHEAYEQGVVLAGTLDDGIGDGELQYSWCSVESLEMSRINRP